MFFNLADQISSIGTDAVGLSGAELKALENTTESVNMTGSTALDQITATAGVTPDLLNQPWIVTIYSTISDFAMIFFWIFFIAGLCAILLNHWGLVPISIGAGAFHIVKKTIVAAFMIANGIPIIMLMLYVNQWASEVFGGSMSVTSLLVKGVVSPLGPVIVLGTCVAIIGNAIFYTIRLFLIYLTCGIWALAWVFWMWDKTAQIGVKMLIFTTVNIFLGAGMCLIYWIGSQFMSVPSSTLTMWGGQVMGLLIMYVALKLPIYAYHKFVSSTPIVNVVVEKAAFVTKAVA